MNVRQIFGNKQTVSVMEDCPFPFGMSELLT